MLLEVLPDLLSKEDWGKAKAVVILIGSNDASLPETNPEQVNFPNPTLQLPFINISLERLCLWRNLERIC